MDLSEVTVVSRVIRNAFASLTPKALANLSPGLERSDNPGNAIRIRFLTLKGLGAWRTLSGCRPNF
jgi:hypothetical protein